MDSLNQVNSVMQPRYFIHKDKALYDLKDGKTTVISNEAKYEISRSLEKTEILLEVHNGHLPHAIKHLDRWKEQFHFRIQQTDRFDQLTWRELEVLRQLQREN